MAHVESKFSVGNSGTSRNLRRETSRSSRPRRTPLPADHRQDQTAQYLEAGRRTLPLVQPEALDDNRPASVRGDSATEHPDRLPRRVRVGVIRIATIVASKAPRAPCPESDSGVQAGIARQGRGTVMAFIIRGV